MLIPAFVINCRNKAQHVARAVRGALEQTVPCEIILSDQGSTDDSLAVMRKAVEEFGPHPHEVKIVECPIHGAYGMTACNAHFMWCVEQTQAEWIFQCSADDYSLPDRVRVCMEAVEGRSVQADGIMGDRVPKYELETWLIGTNPCSAVATLMFFENPGETARNELSGYPKATGYVQAGDGIRNLAYGSVISGYRRDFLMKVGSAGQNTMDVYYGFLAALDQGFYVVADPQHVHVTHASLDNMGFQGKLRAASGDDALLLNELNHLQLMILYDSCLSRAFELHPQGIPVEAMDAAVNAMFGQAQGLLRARKVLNEKGLRPMVLA